MPKGLYIHVPFCASRCPYCDFYVVVSRKPQLPFAQRVIAQLDSYLALRPELLGSLETVFLGGGTPSLLGAETLSWLLRELQTRTGPVAELSLESNPELVCAESLELWQSLGISRLSIGLQSGNDRLLRALGRRSSRRQHEELARLLRRHFSGQYSFDFIYGVPGQPLSDITDTLDFIARHQPHHVSCYELEIAAGTLFARQGLQPAQDSEEMFVRLCRGLESLGYQRYEVSSFARGGRYISRHNELYWRWQPYLGLGPGAVGAALLGQPARVWRAQGSSTWQNADFGVSYSRLSARESLWEYLLMALRLRRGLDAQEFAYLFWPHSPPQNAAQRLSILLQDWLPQAMRRYADFFYWEAGRLRLSDAGFDLQGAFLRAAWEELLELP